MPKISIKSGITLPGQKDYSSLRAEVEFAEIETDGDVKTQIEECVTAIEQTTPAAEKTLAQQLSNLSGLNIEGVGIITQFEEFKSKVRDWAQEMIDEMKELKTPKKTRKRNSSSKEKKKE